MLAAKVELLTHGDMAAFTVSFCYKHPSAFKMSTWVPGCVVTSADSSIAVAPAPGGGSNLSGVSGNILDTSQYTLQGTQTVGTYANFTRTNPSPASFTLVKNACYQMTVPYYLGLPSLPGTAANAAVNFQTLIKFAITGSGTATAYLPNNVIALPSVPGSGPQYQNLIGIYTTTFIVNPTWGPAVNSAGYNPLVINGCSLGFQLNLAGPADYGTAWTLGIGSNVGTGYNSGPPGGPALQGITITRVK